MPAAAPAPLTTQAVMVPGAAVAVETLPGGGGAMPLAASASEGLSPASSSLNFRAASMAATNTGLLSRAGSTGRVTSLPRCLLVAGSTMAAVVAVSPPPAIRRRWRRRPAAGGEQYFRLRVGKRKEGTGRRAGGRGGGPSASSGRRAGGVSAEGGVAGDAAHGRLLRPCRPSRLSCR